MSGPDTVGRYVVEGVLGRGGMGVVYRARDPRLGRTVALKLVDAGGDQQVGRGQLVREAQILARQNHPNIVTIHDAGLSGERVFLAMELVDGGDLEAWLTTKSRSPRDILHLFIEVSDGLQRAHDAGIVHRDIKPHNILVGTDGRPRLTDFGVARLVDPKHSDEETESQPLARLSVRGRLVGTPLYMAPEQLAGGSATRESDQYALCVTLYEAIYGTHPFAARTVGQLLKRQAQRLHFPPESRIPTRARQALARGLHSDPSQRHESVAALARELSPSTRRWGRWAAVAAASAVLLVAWRLPAQDRCMGGARQIDDVWDDATRASIRDRLARTDADYASDLWERVESRIDDHAEAWATTYMAVCQAEPAAPQLDAGMRCLAEARRELEAAVGVLSRLSPADVPTAHRVIEELQDPRLCSDVLPGVEPPAPRDVEAVAATRRRLAEARALRNAGLYDDALATGRATIEAARGIDYPPVRAQLHFEQGLAYQAIDDWVRAGEHFEQALALSRAANDFVLAARTSNMLLLSVGYGQRNFEEGMEYAAFARAYLERSPDANVEIGLHNALGSVHIAAGRFEEGLEHHERALELRRELGKEPRSRDHHNLGVAYLKLQRHQDAERAFATAVRLAENRLGPHHPSLGDSLSGLAGALSSQGRDDEAWVVLERALRLLQAAFDPSHSGVIGVRDAMAAIRRRQGRFDEAEDLLTEALKGLQEREDNPRLELIVRMSLAASKRAAGDGDGALSVARQARTDGEADLGSAHPLVLEATEFVAIILDELGRHTESEQVHRAVIRGRTQAFGEAHPAVGEAEINLAIALAEQGRSEDAIPIFRRGLESLTRGHTADHRVVLINRYNLAMLLERQGDIDGAKQELEDVVPDLERVLGSDVFDTARALSNLGRLRLELGDPQGGLELLERAWPVIEARPGVPFDRAETAFALARALRRLRLDDARSRRLGRDALQAFESLGPAESEMIDVVRHWLAEK